MGVAVGVDVGVAVAVAVAVAVGVGVGDAGFFATTYRCASSSVASIEPLLFSVNWKNARSSRRPCAGSVRETVWTSLPLRFLHVERGVLSLKKYAIEQTCSCRPAGDVASTRTFPATVTESAIGPPA